jgi:adenosyl cobinamide kinase/adenosyl cobinamide phosphate guanylyltransferase
VIPLVLGGARSGKSEVAERLVSALAAGRPVTFVATASPSADDADFAARVAAHQARRPPTWTTIEIGPSDSLPRALDRASGPVLLDSLTTWVASAPGFDADVGGLCAALRTRPGDSVVVSDEVGLGVHPSTEAGRLFRDALGLANQAVADVADDARLVVAGRTLRLDGLERG